ncbi:hypothetical protein A3J13_00470 [Candidatus Daviesbacteria bacterium RIFCSPLOWO2_02_FULL_36_8]|uniref:Plasmid stabilization protein n=1 Tax=Candidatus Daviesbacteria bacterium RIFCSPLOWO2_02_FULL_36_8 TaxID=1797793 RepID=A0A1F5MGE8_9BACT|nr:MAG: hypothetical protein A3J13_00470 [Candidatus Daviesbacteria bacterium RIFCSPLOWO2_02_FULL_36_8]
MIIIFHKDFTKRIKILPRKIQKRFNERLMLFEKDQMNPVLNNHSLKGKYLGRRSINITGDLRVIYQKNDDNVIFVTIDSHSNLYG